MRLIRVHRVNPRPIFPGVKPVPKSSRPLRATKTYKKGVYLTPAGQARIADYARQKRINFSAATETLSLLGLKCDLSEAIVPLVREIMFQALQVYFNRFAKLLMRTAVEAGVSRTLAGELLLQFIRVAAKNNPEQFREALQVGGRGMQILWPGKFVLTLSL